MTKQLIKDLKSSDKIQSYFSVKYKHPLREYRKGFMFVLGLADNSGEIESIYWGDQDKNFAQEIYDSIKENDVVYIEGIVNEFQNKLKIDINKETGIVKKSKEEEYEIEDFVPKTPRDIEEMSKELYKIIDSIKNKYLKELLNTFFSDEHFIREFEKAPAAMYIHQAYIGGLLEHTLNVVKICQSINLIYPKLDTDLLFTGAILHDIGKIKEFVVTSNIKQSEEGMLRGHIILGEEMVLKKIAHINDFPDNLKIKIAHIMLSHHGSTEFGSPKEPQFPEALAVYYADETDSKVSQYIQAKEDANTDDFRTYSKRLGQIYLR